MKNKELIKNSNGAERENNLIKITVRKILQRKILTRNMIHIATGILIIFGLIIGGVSASDQ
ncbi:hypothetical protein BEH94_09500 [Candidatus Altiarchaeales archaeon WOR_SM1_SCG]|nr:hypothetical protein BEH94_09500 [Candidatus Altiarchaeales archaeon WOR_SM1_SCG]ODS41611.1 MAG: hypothetical protein A7315_01120 [Candidatus Altiarchaeales archaeon WOR_SM1_79]